MEVRVPLDPQVTCFLQSKYGCEPLKYSFKDPQVLLLFQLLKCKGKKDPVVPCGPNPTHLQLPDLFIQERRTYLSPDGIREYNETITEYLRNEIREYVYDHRAKRGAKIKALLLEARTKFGLTEDILPYDTIQKDLYRKRKQMESLNKRAV